jgi:hypothetical protein
MIYRLNDKEIPLGDGGDCFDIGQCMLCWIEDFEGKRIFIKLFKVFIIENNHPIFITTLNCASILKSRVKGKC